MQLGPKAAKIISDFLQLPSEDQNLVFSTLSRQQQHHVFQPLPLWPAPVSPQPIPQQNTVWNNKQSMEIVKESPQEEEEEEEEASPKPSRKKNPRKNHTKHIEEVVYEPELITDTCLQVCDAHQCDCRYKRTDTERREGIIPKLVFEGVYVFNLNHDQRYLYIIERAGLTRKDEDDRIRMYPSKGVAYITMNTHEQAVQVYRNLRSNGVSVNWQKPRKG